MQIKITVIILFCLMSPGSVDAQLSDLAAIGSLLNQTTQDLNQEADSGEIEDEDELVVTKEKPDFIDKNYGYTGGNSFVNSPQGKFFDEPLSYFGYDFFVNAPTTFSSVKSIPIPPDYVLGPNDSVSVRLFGNKNATWQLKITSDGDVFLPGIGPLLAAGLTFQDFKKTIQEIVSNQIIGTQVSVTMGKLRSIDIFVLGEVVQPGMYTVSSLTTLTNAIFQSGGVHVTGSLRNIQLKRKGKVISTFDFYDLLLKGDTSKDTRMMQGDVVFIPPITKTVGMAGEVGRPGIYELTDGETLGDLIQFSGNLKPKADLQSATLQRIDSSVNGFNLIQIDLNNFSLDGFELNNGDVLSIYPVVDNLKNAVLVTGHAKQPGFFPWQEGMRIEDLIKSKDNLLSMTDLTYVLVKREDKLSQNYRYLQVDLEEIFRNETPDSNILLLERDEIILFPSLLTPEQITTQLIQDMYIVENDQAVLEQDQWTSMTFLRKSLMDETFSVGGATGPQLINPLTGMAQEGDVQLEEQEVRRYYEYSIYHYCTIPEDLAISIIESSGFRAKQTVPFEDLEKLSTPNDLNNLLQAIEEERTKTRDFETDNLELEMTSFCRRQLLDPEIGVLNRQRASTQETTTVSVFGSVHFPGIYPLTDGMVLGDAIKAAGGLKTATYDSEIELSRSNNVGKRFSVTQSFVSMSNTNAMQTRLQEMDVLTLKQMATNTGSVEITGEVFFNGIFPIAENQTLGELVRRAGGITNRGSVKAAFFVRESIQEAKLKRLEAAKNELRRKILLSSQAGGLGQSSLGGSTVTQLTQLLSNETDDVDALGRLVVDLESILNGTIEDIILEDGDKLHIPTEQQTISVIGEVYMANSHLYEKNLSVDDYIDLSGGTNLFADKNNIYLIKVDGSIVPPSQLKGGAFFRRSASGGLEPGDTIVVPLEVQPFSGAKAATELTQIIYQMAIAAAAVNSF